MLLLINNSWSSDPALARTYSLGAEPCCHCSPARRTPVGPYGLVLINSRL